MKKIAVYPGSFDPITKGHEDIMIRATEIFDEVIVAVLNNPNKKTWFSLHERVEMIKKVIPTGKNIIVKGFEGLLVDFMHANEASITVRGLRALSDYEYELQISLTNSSLSNNSVETIFLPASREHLYVSSSLVKEVALFGGDVSEFINLELIEYMKNKIKTKKEENRW